MKNKTHFYTDAGFSPSYTYTSTVWNHSVTAMLGRYAIWKIKGEKNRPQVIDQGDNIEILSEKYNLTEEDKYDL